MGPHLDEAFRHFQQRRDGYSRRCQSLDYEDFEMNSESIQYDSGNTVLLKQERIPFQKRLIVHKVVQIDALRNEAIN
jgi:hypothetical protein